MNANFRHSAGLYAILAISCSVLFLLYSFKTIYFYTETFLWWTYLLVTTAIFILYAVRCCSTNPPNNLWTLGVAVLLSLLPLNVEIFRLADLIFGEAEYLSDFSRKMPRGVGVVFSVVTYPVLMCLPLLMVKAACTKASRDSKE